MSEGKVPIGRLARMTATKVETIRRHQRGGLLQAPLKTAGNHHRGIGPISGPSDHTA